MMGHCGVSSRFGFDHPAAKLGGHQNLGVTAGNSRQPYRDRPADRSTIHELGTLTIAMSASLFAVCHSLDDFFDRFEAFVGSLDARVRVCLGSIGVTSARLMTEPSGLPTHKRYEAYKQEALKVGGALMTTVSVEQDGRAIEFRLSDWESASIPIDFDPKMVHRAWLSNLARCFELRTGRPAEVESDLGPVRDRDTVTFEAIRQFEEATASVARSNGESVAAAKAFFADATKELARQHACMRSGFEAEQQERRRLFERHLAESNAMDIREHAVVRRELLTKLDDLAKREGDRRPSDATCRLSRRVSVSCCLVWIGGAFLCGLSLLGLPPVARLPLTEWGVAWIWEVLDPEAVWATGWMPEILFTSGMILILTATLVWLRHLARRLKRAETFDDSAACYRRDLLRMSWIAELYLEAADKQRAGEEMEAAVPQILLDRFSRSLFDNPFPPATGVSHASGSTHANASPPIEDSPLADAAQKPLADAAQKEVAAGAGNATSPNMGSGKDDRDSSEAGPERAGRETSRPLPVSHSVEPMSFDAAARR